MISRRSFLKALAGGAVALSAGGIALLDAEPIIRTYFLPPRGGWNAGTWELALAQEALRIVDAKLSDSTFDLTAFGTQTFRSWDQQQIASLIQRRQRLVERCDKLARGWTPTRSHRVLYAADGTRFETIIHGGRSRG